MKYEKASAEVVLFDNSDVITASSLNNNYSDEAEKVKEENPDNIWGCSDVTSKVNETWPED